MAGGALIADGNAERAKRVAEACEARGVPARLALHGAAALESALRELPAVLVASAELPLIDAQKLAGILRANPRAQHVRLVLMGPDPGRGIAERFFDEILPLDADPGDVALRVEEIVERQERLRAMEQEEEARHELQGKLSQVPLTDLLQLLHMNRRTGTLDLSRHLGPDRAEQATVQVRDGNVLQARVGVVEGEKALFRLLAWREGSFVFGPLRGDAAPRITTPTRALLLEGLRQLDEWEQRRGSLPSPEARASLQVKSVDLPSMAQPLTREVLLLIDLYPRVQELLDHSTFPDYQVLQTLQTLVDRGLVELSAQPVAAFPAPAGLIGPAQARRLRDWMQIGHARGPTRGDAKLLLVAAEGKDLLDFLDLLRRLPDLRLEVPRRPVAATDLVRVARIAVDGEVGIQFLHLPAQPIFAPLWPLAAHGALATVFLLGAAPDRAAKALESVREALGRSARTLHVLLQADDAAPPREAARRSLGLEDDAPLFVLRTAGEPDPLAAVRALLAGVLP
jgi:hypothetical protein